MERIRGWLLRRYEDPPADEDTVSNLPLLHRQVSGARHSGDGNESEASVGSTGFSFGELLHRLTPSTNLLKLTDPDKGERSTLLNRGSLWTPDRGSGFYQTQRDRWSAPHLVTTGRHAGRSRVGYEGIEGRELNYHVWKRDFFTSCINLRLPYAITAAAVAYTASFFFWATVWWAIWKLRPECVVNFDGYVTAFVFAVATQQTIGYGDVSPGSCWLANTAITVQSVFALLLNAVVVGIVFARVSRPGQRGRTIFLSDSAVIARRDGELKFMFRVADIRPRYQVVSPRMSAHLYTWGAGHTTAEGERIPVKMEKLDISYCDGMMLLPITVEHTIDERSPLWGHSHDSLLALGAEVVVVFEGTSEFGHQFSTRQSYLPREIHWGYQFVQIVHPAPPDSTKHVVDIARFHEIEPQSTVMELLRPSQLARKVLAPPRGMIPSADLGANTLVVSDMLAVSHINGTQRLAVRIGDTRPSHMKSVHVRMHLYRWRSRGSSQDSCREAFDVQELDISGNMGPDRMCLRLPVVVTHMIRPSSPLQHWASSSGILLDADSEIVVSVEAVTYAGEHLASRQVTYSVLSDIKTGHRFAPMVLPPSETQDGHPGIDWSAFHTLVPVPEPGAELPQPQQHFRPPQHPQQPAQRHNSAPAPAAPRPQHPLRSPQKPHAPQQQRQQQGQWQQNGADSGQQEAEDVTPRIPNLRHQPFGSPQLSLPTELGEIAGAIPGTLPGTIPGTIPEHVNNGSNGDGSSGDGQHADDGGGGVGSGEEVPTPPQRSRSSSNIAGSSPGNTPPSAGSYRSAAAAGASRTAGSSRSEDTIPSSVSSAASGPAVTSAAAAVAAAQQRRQQGTALHSLEGDPLHWHKSRAAGPGSGGRGRGIRTPLESDNDSSPRPHLPHIVSAPGLGGPPSHTGASTSSRSAWSRGAVASASGENTPNSTTASDQDQWQTSRALRNVYFPPPEQSSPR